MKGTAVVNLRIIGAIATAVTFVTSAASSKAQEWWSAPTDLGGVTLNSGPSAVAGGLHRIDIFYSGPNSHLWTSWWDGGEWWSSPVDLGGVQLTSEPAAVRYLINNINTYVFYRGPNNHLWTSWWPDKPGSQWWSAPKDLGGVEITSAPAAIVGRRHTIDVYYRGPNNHVWTSWWPDKPGSQWWSAPTDLGGVEITSAPTAVGGLQKPVTGGVHDIDLYYRGPNNHVWTSWWPDKPGSQWWSAPTDLGGVEISSAPTSVLAGHTREDARLTLFYGGPNNHLWTSWWPDKPGSQWWSAPTDLGGVAIASVPAALSNDKDQIDVFYRGPNNHLWTSWWPDKPWLDAQTGQLSPNPAPFDVVTKSFDPDNGYPLNPMLGSQTWSPSRLANSSLCGGGDPWKSPCTKQVTWIDKHSNCAGQGPLGGHANWGMAVYEGKIMWSSHSAPRCDDDYNFALFRDDLAGLTEGEETGNPPEYLHCEFNSDETIDDCERSWFWRKLHQTVDDDDGGEGQECDSPGVTYPQLTYKRTHALLDSKDAIVMGLYGLDCAHTCAAEIHPVLALAIHVKRDLNDDTWAIFVRNGGDEGYCSTGKERVEPEDLPFSFTFRFRQVGAASVSYVPTDLSWDEAGQFGTSLLFDGDQGGATVGWYKPVLIPGVGAAVTFALPPSKHGAKIFGMLHLKWTLTSTNERRMSYRTTSASVSDIPKEVLSGTIVQETEIHEDKVSRALRKMTPGQRAMFNKLLRSTRHRPLAGKLLPEPLSGKQTDQPPIAWKAKHVSDETRQRRQELLEEMLHRAAGER